jgi:thiosulfate/3-mercaptopyruvate sulfurtransferase
MTLAHPEWLVGTGWLEEHLRDPELRVFDVTARLSVDDGVGTGRDAYDEAHVPGAGFLDLVGDLSDPDNPAMFMRASPERLARVLGAAGIADDSRVVLYSTTHVMWATRVFWLLRGIGFDAAAVLDGGLARWRDEDRPLCSEPCAYPGARLDARPRPALWADRDEVLAAIGDASVCTVNALPRVFHTGEAERHYGRPGRIAGSVNVPFTGVVDPETGRFRTPEQWRAAFQSVGAFERARVITYCGGAIAGTVDALALAALGHPDVAVYDGSLDEWTRDPSLPMETGEPGDS